MKNSEEIHEQTRALLLVTDFLFSYWNCFLAELWLGKKRVLYRRIRWRNRRRFNTFGGYCNFQFLDTRAPPPSPFEVFIWNRSISGAFVSSRFSICSECTSWLKKKNVSGRAPREEWRHSDPHSAPFWKVFKMSENVRSFTVSRSVRAVSCWIVF